MIHTRRDRHTRQAARKGLFIDMRMRQFAHPQRRAIRRQHLPCIGIVVPARIGMAQRYIEGPCCAVWPHRGAFNLRGVCHRGQGERAVKAHHDETGFHVPIVAQDHRAECSPLRASIPTLPVHPAYRFGSPGARSTQIRAAASPRPPPPCPPSTPMAPKSMQVPPARNRSP